MRRITFSSFPDMYARKTHQAQVDIRSFDLASLCSANKFLLLNMRLLEPSITCVAMDLITSIFSTLAFQAFCTCCAELETFCDTFVSDLFCTQPLGTEKQMQLKEFA